MEGETVAILDLQLNNATTLSNTPKLYVPIPLKNITHTSRFNEAKKSDFNRNVYKNRVQRGDKRDKTLSNTTRLRDTDQEDGGGFGESDYRLKQRPGRSLDFKTEVYRQRRKSVMYVLWMNEKRLYMADFFESGTDPEWFEMGPTGETRAIPGLETLASETQMITRLTSTSPDSGAPSITKVQTGRDSTEDLTKHTHANHNTSQSMTFLGRTFMSASKMKKIYIPRHHRNTFGGTEYVIPTARGVPLHTSRYLCEGGFPFPESADQRDRLQSEHEYLNQVRLIKLRRDRWPHRDEADFVMAGKKLELDERVNIEINALYNQDRLIKLRRDRWPHRDEADFVMAGKKLELDERFDLNHELGKLKALVLPEVARDLLHGRGVSLPANHSSLKPRKILSEFAHELDALTAQPSLGQKPQTLHLNPCEDHLGRYDDQISVSVFNSSVTSLPAIDNRAMGGKNQTTIQKAREHTRSLRTLLSL